MKPLTHLASVEWGYGRPEQVRPATREATEIVVFLSDIHFPYQESGVVKSALKLIKSVQPHRVVLNGDINDFFQMSRFNNELERLDSLQDEIDQANEFRGQVRKAVPNAVIDENEGNHDNRIRSYVAQNAKPLHTLRGIQPEVLFMYDEYGINWHPGAGFLLRPSFLVKHGTSVSSVPSGTARTEAMLNLCSGISGHVHRAERFEKSGAVNSIQWTVTGTMCRLDPDYIVGSPNWNQGVAVGEFSTKSDSFYVTQVPYIDNRLRFGAKGF